MSIIPQDDQGFDEKTSEGFGDVDVQRGDALVLFEMTSIEATNSQNSEGSPITSSGETGDVLGTHRPVYYESMPSRSLPQPSQQSGHATIATPSTATAGNYTIVESELPLVGGVGGHHLLVILDPNGNVVEELDGLATSSAGAIKPIGYLPSDTLKAYSFSSDYLYSTNQTQSVLYTGSYSDVMNRYNAAVTAEGDINSQNLHYPFMGLGENSNSVATTLIDAMGLDEPNLHGALITPGEGSQLLTNSQLNAIQSQYGILPTYHGDVVDTYNSNGQISTETTYDTSGNEVSECDYTYSQDGTSATMECKAPNGAILQNSTLDVNQSQGTVSSDLQGTTSAGQQYNQSSISQLSTGQTSTTTIAGQGDSTDLANDNITLTGGAQATVIGSGNTFNLSSNAGANLTIDGSGSIVYSSGNTIAWNGSGSATINGGSDVVTTAGGTLTLNGQGFNVTDSTGSTFTAWLDAGSNGIINGVSQGINSSYIESLGYNTSAQETAQTIYSASSGWEQQSITYNPSTGYASNNMLFGNILNGQDLETQDTLYNAQGQATQFSTFGTNGYLTEVETSNGSTPYYTNAYLTNGDGGANFQYIDSFNGTTGALTESNDYNVSSGALQQVSLFNGGSYAYEEEFTTGSDTYFTQANLYNNATGALTQANFYDGGSGDLQQTSLYNGGSYAYEEEFTNGTNPYYAQANLYNSSTGALTQSDDFNDSNGALLQANFFNGGTYAYEEEFTNGSNPYFEQANLYNTSSGALTQSNDYNDTNGDLLQANFFNGGEYAYKSEFTNGTNPYFAQMNLYNTGTGALTQSSDYNDTTGALLQTNLFSGGSYAYEEELTNGSNPYYGQILLFNPTTGAELQSDTFNSVTGALQSQTIYQGSGTSVGDGDAGSGSSGYDDGSGDDGYDDNGDSGWGDGSDAGDGDDGSGDFGGDFGGGGGDFGDSFGAISAVTMRGGAAKPLTGTSASLGVGASTKGGGPTTAPSPLHHATPNYGQPGALQASLGPQAPDAQALIHAMSAFGATGGEGSSVLATSQPAVEHVLLAHAA